ncbi:MULTISPECIES: M23 family metallopeptidase [unclassified Parabacteroides]|uniref:M23 family metallopeptidase n=1 Tax=unclassified Parabacteroides TaxID=2649774 RepID=UPI0024743B74|nr:MULTISPECIES: M23 family metallopeptidase [unclassified Parabacteroides]
MSGRSSHLFVVLLLLFFLGGSVSCHAPRYADHAPTLFFPSLDGLDLPSVSAFNFYIPEPEWKQIDLTPRKRITLDFTYYDTHHVRSQDCLLFCNSDTEIIDLAFLSENDYAFPLPGAKVISPYAGKRSSHSGVDLKTCAHDTIVAAFDGVVRMAQPYAAYGNVVVVRHYNGLETVYSHNSKNLVKSGDVVKAGYPVALTGRTGRATTEHLHFETRINGQHFNPSLVFDFTTKTLQPQNLLCIKKGSSIVVKAVDPFPFHLVFR